MVELIPVVPGDEALAVSFVQKYYSEDHLEFSPKVESAIHELVSHPEWGAYHKIVCDEGLVGYLGFTYAFDQEVGGRFGMVTDFYIEPKFRGKGIGSEALQLVITLAKSLDLKEIGLVVLGHNDRVRPLYERQGFRAEKGRSWMWLDITEKREC